MKRPAHFPTIYEVARAEVDAWTHKGTINRGLVIAIIFAFCHRLTTGKTVEESFNSKHVAEDWSI